VLRRANFLRLWVGSVTSAAGAAVGGLIITWLVYTATHSPLTISLLGIVQFLPTLAFGLIAGALIDRLDRRRLMVTCDAARAVCFGTLAVVVVVLGADTALLLVVVFLVATFSTIFRPATNATVPRILPPEEISDGNGLLQGGTTIAQFVGSPMGGLLLITLGAAVGLAINALTFAISGALILLMVIPSRDSPTKARAESRPSLLHEVSEGLRYLRSQRALLIITFASMGANFFLSIWGGFTVIYVAVQLHQGAAGFGGITAATTAGFAIGALLPGRLRTDHAPGIWVTSAWGSVGLFIIALAFTTNLVAAIGLEFAAGLLLSLGNTTWLSTVQRTVPDEYLGRYFATDEAGSFAMIPAALAVGGVLVLLIGISRAFLLAGVGALVPGIGLLLSSQVRQWGRAQAAPDASTAG
jgi:MFS family permease